MERVANLLIEVTVEAKAKAEQEKLGQALARLAAEHPAVRVVVDRERGHVIKGVSEPDVEAFIGLVGRIAGIDLDAGAPRVCYRETITRPAEIGHTYAKLTGASGQFARIVLRFEPVAPGGGYAFENAVVGGAVPREYIGGVTSGLDKARETGVLGGFPVIDLKVTLIDGAYHDVDSSVQAFEAAAGAAFREGVMKAAPCLLEPVMEVEVVTPAEHLDAVVGDLKARRGDIVGIDDRGDAKAIMAMVPLADMLGYARTIEALSHGRGRFAMRFSHHAPAPPPDDGPFRPAIGMRA